MVVKIGTLCVYCILYGDSHGGGAKVLPFENDSEEFFNHIEMEHDIPVRRIDETKEEASARVKAKNPRMGSPNCQCPACKHARGEI